MFARHQPVLLAEVLEFMQPTSGGVYLDCTVGAGGHAAAILAACAPDGRLVGIDRDQDAIELARARLAPFGERVHLVHGNFADLETITAGFGIARVDGVLFDLGVSSMQLDEEERGFSYQAEAFLDMRMDRTQELTAADVVNQLPEKELAAVILRYGEEKWAARIAKKIVEARERESILTTGRLVEVVKEAIPAVARRHGGHPARRTFQAIRIKVNDELKLLSRGLVGAVSLTRTGARICAISFHSLEDRIVKTTFSDLARRCTCPPGLPQCGCSGQAKLKILTRKPVKPSPAELSANPRARSAKLRAAEKIGAF